MKASAAAKDDKLRNESAVRNGRVNDLDDLDEEITQMRDDSA